MWACVHVCVSVEKAWPRLIAASYLVVTGLIKDDELTVGLSLSPSSSLPSFGRKIDRQPPVPHYGLFLERRGGWEDDGEGEGERGGRKKDKAFHFSFPLLRGQHGSKNWPECLRGRGTQVAAQWAYSPPLKK